MNIMDIILLLLLALGTYLGYKRGLFISLVRLCAIIVGLAAGTFLWSHTQEWLLRLGIHISPLPAFLLFVFALVLTFFLFMFIAKNLKKAIYLTPIRFLDKGIGALFGMTTWTLLLGLLLWMTHGIQHTAIEKYLRKSTIAATLQQSTETILIWMIPQKHIEKMA